ncbi:MAG: amidohydrolase, partial [Flavobacteriaceae bacterium]|nr:amidohydrolase [Flavobacteriaceae bacterium]
MKILKKVFKVVLALVLLLIFALLIIVAVDYNNTSYLKVKNNQSAKNNSYIIKNINIIPMHIDTVLTNKMVYVKEGVIQQIADDIKVENIEVFDGQQKYLSPGLIDMHVHVWDKYELGLYLSNGVTSVRNVWGMPMHLRFKELINNDEILAPNFYTTGPKLTGPEFIGDDNLNLISPEQAKENIKRYKDKGYDFIKTYYGLPEDIFDAVL